MHSHSLKPWQHGHDFLPDHSGAEKSTARVMWLTAAMMVIEIAAGAAFGSMALLADGWHMATHVAAFGIALFAYRYARRHADNPRFSFGTGKVSVLGGFASAVALAVVALMMALESVGRLFAPQQIQFDEAIAIAVLGLVVNLVSGLMLREHHHHDHGHDHGHGEEHDDHDDRAHHHHHHDHNLRAAYLHVLADALTSVLAIVALLAGKYFGWLWVDAAMGLVGAALITRWAWGLTRDTSHILLDGMPDIDAQAAIRAAIEADGDSRVADLHVWQLGPQHLSAALAVVTHEGRSPEHYKQRLAHIPRLAHVLVEVNACSGEVCAPLAPGGQEGYPSLR